MKLKQYQKYKESNIDWIGKIPEEWEVKKIKHFSISIAGGTPDTTNTAYWDGKIPWLPSGMVHDKSIYKNEVKTFITLKGVQNSSTKWIKKDSILVALTGATCANIAYLTFRATANQSVIGIQVNDATNSRYIFYYLLSQRKQILINQTGGAQGGINKDNVINLICSFPQKEKQDQIASFLDSKTSQINQTLEKDKKLIELLKEKRIALINYVVTKGLNPKAKMEDSGIDWIGEIPMGWEVRKIDKFSTVSRGASPRPIDDPIYFDDEGEYAWVRIADVSASSRYLEETTEKLSTLGKSLSVALEPGRLFVSIAGTVGKPIITKIKCCIHDGFVYFKNLKVLNEYLYYIFIGGQAYLGLGKWGTQLNLNTETIGLIPIPLPPKKEQLQITQYLDKATSKIDKTIKKIEEKITLMEEYQKSLIHHVVTGKVDVRVAVA